MKKLILFSCLLLTVGAAAAQSKPKSAKKSMQHTKQGFVHTVYFWMKEPGSQAAKDSLYAGLQLLATIPDIREAYIGVPAATRRPVIDHTYDYAITFVFKDKAAHDVYQEHATHKKFIAQCEHLWQRVQVYDATDIR